MELRAYHLIHVVCNPSPRAYFKEQNGRLVCQNCGNVFTTDSVGETTGGCNPMYIDYKNTDGKLTASGRSGYICRSICIVGWSGKIVSSSESYQLERWIPYLPLESMVKDLKAI